MHTLSIGPIVDCCLRAYVSSICAPCCLRTAHVREPIAAALMREGRSCGLTGAKSDARWSPVDEPELPGGRETAPRGRSRPGPQRVRQAAFAQWFPGPQCPSPWSDAKARAVCYKLRGAALGGGGERRGGRMPGIKSINFPPLEERTSLSTAWRTI